MGLNPNFAASVQLGLAQISTANANLDGTGTMGDVVTGAANGTLIEEIIIKAAETTTAGMVRLFIYDETNVRLWLEIAVSAVTASGTVPAWTNNEYHDDARPLLCLPPNWVLRAATEEAETFNVLAIGGDF